MNSLKSMFNSNRSQRTPNPITEPVRTPPADAPAAGTFSMDEMTQLLQVPPDRLRQWTQLYPNFLEAGAQRGQPRYSRGDLATLIVIQRLLEAGHEHEQVMQRLQHNSSTLDDDSAKQSSSAQSAPEQSPDDEPAPEPPESTFPPVVPRPYNHQAASPAASSTSRGRTANLLAVNSSAKSSGATESRTQHNSTTAIQPGHSPDGINELLRTVSDSQQSMLNVQDSIREMLGVIVQDNFNLKHENRKLRDRMLELERTLAEYQRREETRKERMEGRLRALESTLSAIQQQVAQLVQLYRQRNNNKRGWFR